MKKYPYIVAWICQQRSGQMNYGATLCSALNEQDAIEQGIAHAKKIHPMAVAYGSVADLLTPEKVQAAMSGR